MGKVALFTVVVALIGAAPAAADPAGFVIDGIAVSPKKIHFGTVTIGSCSLQQPAGCTVRMVTVTNTSSLSLEITGAGVVDDAGIGLGVGLNDLGTCLSSGGVVAVVPGGFCTAIVTAGYSGFGTVQPGVNNDGLLFLYGHFVGSSDTTIARIPLWVRNVV